MKADAFVDWNVDMVRRFPSVDYYERSHPVVRWIERHRLRFLAREVARAAPASLLEIGCGACHVLEHLPAALRVGTDISPTMLAVSARRTSRKSIHLVRCLAERLPFADDSFDCVVCTEVLEHVPAPSRLVAEAARVLSSGGVALFTVPHEALIDLAKKALALTRLDRRRFANVAEARAKGWHIQTFTRSSFQRMLAEHLTVARVVPLPSALLPIRYAACCPPLPAKSGTGRGERTP